MAKLPLPSSLLKEEKEKNISCGELNEFLNELCTIALLSKSSISKEWSNYLKFAQGEHWSKHIADYKVPFTLDLVGKTLKNKAALLTDTKPIIEISPRGDLALTPVAEVLQFLVRNYWDARAVLASLTRSLYFSQIFGASPMNVVWDEDLHYGQGDIDLVSFDVRHFLLDPGVVCSDDLQKAEYIVLESIYPLNRVFFEYPEASTQGLIADPQYSKYSSFGGGDDGFNSGDSITSPSVVSSRRPFKTGVLDLKDSVIPRVIVQEFWIRDRVRMGDLNEEQCSHINSQLEEQGLSPKTKKDLVFSGGRHIVRANGKILVDEHNPYWDLAFPCEMMSWGMEIEHPWGRSEVGELMKIQRIINKLGGAMVENTLLMSNSIWIGDSNALNPEQWRELTSKPGLIVKKRPGSELRREPAPALPGSVFGLMQWLTQSLSDVSGMTDVLQGKAGNQTTGVAIELLQQQSQALLRLQARNMEIFLERIGQKLISRIFQFVSPKRIMAILGANEKILDFELKRDDILGKIDGLDPRNAFRDFVFKIEPLSSLSMSRMQALISTSNLYSMGLVTGVEVLKKAQFPNPEDTFEKAKIEAAAKLSPQGSPIAQGPPPKQGPKPGPGQQ